MADEVTAAIEAEIAVMPEEIRASARKLADPHADEVVQSPLYLGSGLVDDEAVS